MNMKVFFPKKRLQGFTVIDALKRIFAFLIGQVLIERIFFQLHEFFIPS